MKKTLSIVFVFISLFSFGQNVHSPQPVSLYGTVYNSSSWANLSAFVDSSSGCSVSGSTISCSGGSGNSKFLNYNYISLLEHFKLVNKITLGTVSTSATNFAIGAASVNPYANVSWRATASFTTGGVGTLKLDYNYTGTWTTLATNSTTLAGGAMTASSSDNIILILERNVGVYSARLIDVNTGAEIDQSYSTGLVFNISVTPPVTNNTCMYATYNLGPNSFVIDSIAITSAELKYGVGSAGDSRWQGYGASTFNQRAPYLISQKLPNMNVGGGGGDRWTEFLSRINEVIALKPTYFLLNSYSINDLASGQSLATVETNFASAVTQLQAAGINVIILLPYYITGGYQANTITFKNWILANYSAYPIIDTWSATNFSGAQQSDGVHETPAGYSAIASAVLNSGLLPFGSNVLDNAGGASVVSISNSDGSLTISPTTGAAVASINQGFSPTWTAAHTFTASTAPQITVGDGSSLPTGGNLIRFNFAASGGGGFNFSAGGTSLMTLNGNQAASFSGTANASSGRQINWNDATLSVVRGGIDANGNLIIGPSGSSNTMIVYQPGTNNPSALFTQTLTASNSSGLVSNTTGFGSASVNQVGFYATLNAGYTGTSFNAAIRGVNNSVSTGTNAGPVNVIASSIGSLTGSAGSSNSGVGGYHYSLGAHKNIGSVNDATLSQYNNAAGVSGGSASYALRANASAIEFGGFFGLMSTEPTYESAALIADNGAESVPIFLARANGTKVAAITSGGKLLDGSATDNSTAQLQVTSTTAQIAAHYDATHYTTFTTNSSGYLTITPSGAGATTYFAGPVDPSTTNSSSLGSSSFIWNSAYINTTVPNRRTVADAAISVNVNDYLIAYTSITASRAVTLQSAASVPGQYFIIKDESGSASGTNTITAVGTIDGASNPTMINTAYGVKRIYSNGSAYFSW